MPDAGTPLWELLPAPTRTATTSLSILLHLDVAGE